MRIKIVDPRKSPDFALTDYSRAYHYWGEFLKCDECSFIEGELVLIKDGKLAKIEYSNIWPQDTWVLIRPQGIVWLPNNPSATILHTTILLGQITVKYTKSFFAGNNIDIYDPIKDITIPSQSVDNLSTISLCFYNSPRQLQFGKDIKFVALPYDWHTLGRVRNVNDKNYTIRVWL